MEFSEIVRICEQKKQTGDIQTLSTFNPPFSFNSTSKYLGFFLYSLKSLSLSFLSTNSSASFLSLLFKLFR